MAQIGYGYGSEFHLLRFLGHHRNELESVIVKAAKSKSKDFFWLDFDYADRNKVISGDAEMVGLSFLKEASNLLDSKKNR